MHWIFTDNLSPFIWHTTFNAEAHPILARIALFIWHTNFNGSDLGIRWYGAAYLLGFVLVYLFYRAAALRHDIPGFEIADVDSLTIRVIAGVMLGGRLGFVLQHPVKLLHDPLFIFRIWEGGMAYFGGLAGVILAEWSFARMKHISILAFTDIMSVVAALGLGIGRIANFVNGELYGTLTHSDWGVIFQGGGPQPRHPSQLYECASHLLLFAILFYLAKRWRGRVRPGAISFLYLILYGVFRFFTDFYRQDDVYWMGISDGQWVSLAIAAGGAIALFAWSRQRGRSGA